MSYEIIVEFSVQDLEREVNAYLQNGYKVAGGVSVVHMMIEDRNGGASEQYEFYQAMIRPTV